ncbi:MAG: diguanylate cyclase [Thermomicrobia bacterium]|nr:diguanylate cyclase [Thermomicrobia bacterium]
MSIVMIDMDETVRTFVHALAVSLEQSSVTLYERDGDDLVPRAHGGLGTIIERVRIDRGVIGRVFRTAQPALVRETENDADFLPFGTNVQSEMVVPILVDGAVFGVVDVQSARPLDPFDLELLALVTQRISATIQQAKRYAGAERRAARAETLLDIGVSLGASLDPGAVVEAVLDQIARLVPYEGAALLTLAEGGILRLADGRGPFAVNADLFAGIEPGAYSLTKAMTETGKPFLISDVPTHYNGVTPPAFAWLGSVIVAPLRVEGQLIGAIMVGGTTRARYTPDDAAIVAELARHAAVALRNAQLHDAVAHAAQTDALTGLFNRGALLERLERELERSRRYGRSLTVIFFDLDRFKNINDTYGHQFGDRVLRDLARIATQTVRSIDLVGRYGGEEFVAVLPETDGAQALIVAERLRLNVARHRLDLPSGEAVGTTISAGVAVFPADATTMDTLIRIADTALYAAKAGGRNRVQYGNTSPGA